MFETNRSVPAYLGAESICIRALAIQIQKMVDVSHYLQDKGNLDVLKYKLS
jgi:hypothetical protein